MKMPKECRRFCARCKKHTTHVMSIYKKGKERSTKEGTRRHAARKEGYGGQKFPELEKTAKTTKKQVIRLKCSECDMGSMKDGLRIRKLEIVA